MADNVYELNININGGGRRSSSVSASGTSSVSTESKGILSSVQDFYKDTKRLLNTTGVALVVGSVINYQTSRVGITTGNYQRQQEITANKQIAGQLVAIVGSVLGKNYIGAGLAAVGIGLSYYQAYDSYNFSRKAEAATLAIRREREGLISVSRSRGAVQ